MCIKDINTCTLENIIVVFELWGSCFHVRKGAWREFEGSSTSKTFLIHSEQMSPHRVLGRLTAVGTHGSRRHRHAAQPALKMHGNRPHRPTNRHNHASWWKQSLRPLTSRSYLFVQLYIFITQNWHSAQNSHITDYGMIYFWRSPDIWCQPLDADSQPWILTHSFLDVGSQA